MNTQQEKKTCCYVVSYTAMGYNSHISGVLSVHATNVGAFRRAAQTADELKKYGNFYEVSKTSNRIKIERKADYSEIELFVEQRPFEE